MNIEQIRTIENKKDELIERVEDFFNAREKAFQEKTEEQKQGKPLEGYLVPVKHTQLQNLVGLALATKSVDEITLFIQYQIGREAAKKDPKQPEWTEDSFGTELIKNIRQVAGGVADKEMKISLVRLFIGYFMRYARYLKPTDEKSED